MYIFGNTTSCRKDDKVLKLINLKLSNVLLLSSQGSGLRIQMTKPSNQQQNSSTTVNNSNYLSMNSFNNNNNQTAQNGSEEATMETSDNLLLQSTTNTASQRWTTARNGSGSQKSSLSWHVRICTSSNTVNGISRNDMSLSLNGNNKVTNTSNDDAMMAINSTTNNSNNICPSSPFDCEARYRKTWI